VSRIHRDSCPVLAIFTHYFFTVNKESIRSPCPLMEFYVNLSGVYRESTRSPQGHVGEGKVLGDKWRNDHLWILIADACKS